MWIENRSYSISDVCGMYAQACTRGFTACYCRQSPYYINSLIRWWLGYRGQRRGELIEEVETDDTTADTCTVRGKHLHVRRITRKPQHRSR